MNSPARARTIVAALAEQGVRHVVYSPGSRDAPFAYALAAAERSGVLHAHVRIDERSAAFYALGLARAGEIQDGHAHPVALVMTSGTAVANAHPAVLEAAHACVPLIVIAADRPAYMRGTGANQTTDHAAILGGTVRGTWDVASGDGVWAVRRGIAVATGSTGPAGPVLLTVALDVPLLDSTATGALPTLPVAASPTGVEEKLDTHVGRFIPVATNPVHSPSLAALGLTADLPGIIIAGNQASITPGGEHLPDLAAALGWPLLAEPSSGVRRTPALTCYQDELARLAQGVTQILVVGHPTLSRPVTAVLTDPARHVAAIARAGTYTNLGDNVRVVGDQVPQVPQVAHSEHTAKTAHTGACTTLDLRERYMACLWARHAVPSPRPPLLVLGASLAIRACDRAGQVTDYAPEVLANRGLAGIDGTVSFARGVAAGSGRPVRVVVGDLTFMHDVGGLATGVHETSEDVQVIVLNDGGGQIFRTLEYGRDAALPDYERFFATPQRMALPAIAASFGWEYIYAASVAQLDYVAAHAVRGESIVEVDLTSTASTIPEAFSKLSDNPH